MRYRRRSYFRSSHSRSSAAGEHMSARRMLSSQVAGIDQDVLNILYGFDDHKLVDVLAAYERLHGKSAADYLEKAIPRWRDGKTGVSGQSAARLVNLVPKFLTRDQRYALLKKLYEANKWRHHENIRVEVILGHTEDVTAKIGGAMQRLCNKPSLNTLRDGTRIRMRASCSSWWASGSDCEVSCEVVICGELFV